MSESFYTREWYQKDIDDLEDKLAAVLERERCLRSSNTGLMERLEKECAEVDRLRAAITTQSHTIEQTLGRALGYPRFCDDPANFPDATYADGVCVGEHVAETLAIEAARKIADLTAALAVVGQPRCTLIEIAPTVWRVDQEVTDTHSTTFYGPQAEAEARRFAAKQKGDEI